ncbi:hypothetical protein S820908_011 [Synechococcus phage S-CAM9]|uniref:Uncharacterized protein n=1 Tax=Synechococcus phage S-CAM9 TaxID=1883369 RepID=A0A1D8KNZ1_9CAUD|nr:hypothetical protein BOW85_gp011 [Synechococcus phage S-CAM9]AOV60158.1 hypothetical protein S050808_011 [Synechococcus phage S-CAM9]AOV60386.1 hypothetical protein S820908_011 [Synechococcus phage S-CAM9]AOV60614.1 hypothetical protein N161109_011 [Synechococcus phage S-CAM9]
MAFVAAAKSFIGGIGSFLAGQAMRRRDDGLGNRENRKKLAARAFLEGYEPDPRLFAKGPDDAPDVFMPEPLVEPVETYLPPSPQVPQLVGATTGAVGEEFVVREIERINANVNAIALAMEANAKADADYRQSIIRQQKDRLAQRGQARSRRRSDRSRDQRNFLTRRARSLQKGFKSTFKGIQPNVAGFLALEAVDQIQKRFDQLINMLPQQIRGFLGLGTEDVEPPPERGRYQESSVGGSAALQAGLQFIRQSEGTLGEEGFSKFFGGSLAFGDLREKTFSEVAGYQKQFLAEGGGMFYNPATGKMDQSAAVGAGQFLYPERDLKNYLNMDPDTTLFSEENQLKLIIAIAAEKRGVDLNKPLTIEDLKKLQDEWAGIASGRYKQNSRTLQGAMDAYKQILDSIKVKPTTPDTTPVDPFSPLAQSFAPIATFGEGMNMMDPTIIDLRSKDIASVGGAGAASNFDVSGVVLDPFVPSEYAPILGVN